MKKRIALAAAIALAISVGGMIPASAKPTAPTITVSACARAGGVLEAKAKGGSIAVALDEAHPGYLSITISGTSDAGATCAFDDLAITGLTSVLVKAGENVSINLAKSDGLTAYDYGSIPMTVQAVGTLTFDGSGLDQTAYVPFVGTITEDAFTIGTVVGTYYAGEIEFLGGNGADTADASGVTTTTVSLMGGPGDDTLKGGALGDHLVGNQGDDVLYGNGGNDTLASSDGGVSCAEPWPGANPQNNPCKTENVDNGADEAWGGAGNDTFTPDAADVVAPGDGTDTVNAAVYQLRYSDSSAAVSINLSTAAGVVKSTAGDDYVGAFHEFVGSPFADTLVGNANANGFFGFDGADAILGFGGADLLSGNGGTDAIKGGAGTDEIYGDTGADKINGGADNDLVYGGSADDILYGSAGDDVLRGMKGTDQAWGGKGTFDVCSAEVTDSCEFNK